jgi:phage gp36-like protein
MSYASQDDIEERYPGRLAVVAPKTADGDIDTTAVDLALQFADSRIDESLRLADLEYVAPYPLWIVDDAVDVALYRVTDAALLPSFEDIKTRADAALARLRRIATGDALPPTAPAESPVAGQGSAGVTFASKPRRGWGAR